MLPNKVDNVVLSLLPVFDVSYTLVCVKESQERI